MSAYVKFVTKYVITAYDSKICYIMYTTKVKYVLNICDELKLALVRTQPCMDPQKMD